jgi:hypothetical protein
VKKMHGHVSADDPVARELGDALSRVLADLRGAGLLPDAGHFNIISGQSIVGAGARPRGFMGEGFVLRVDGSDHLVADDSTGTADPVDIVAIVQDWAMDQLGATWPEVHAGAERFGELLTPRFVDGVLTWCGSHAEIAPVGDLHASPGV